MASDITSPFAQDSTIPIYIILQWRYSILKFPINPEELEMNIDSSSETANVIGLGEVSLPTTPKLATLNIETFLWQAIDYTPNSLYVYWLKRWQKSKEPARLIVTRFNYSMKVTCESFAYSIKAGEEADIYIKLSLKEYRDYGIKKFSMVTNETLLTKIKNKLAEASVALDAMSVVQLSIPLRSGSGGVKTYENPYTVGKDETISSITKKITGSTSDWKALYDENTDKLTGDNVEGGIETGIIKEGIKLTLPQSWIDNESYHIVSPTENDDTMNTLDGSNKN